MKLQLFVKARPQFQIFEKILQHSPVLIYIVQSFQITILCLPLLLQLVRDQGQVWNQQVPLQDRLSQVLICQSIMSM